MTIKDQIDCNVAAIAALDERSTIKQILQEFSKASDSSKHAVRHVLKNKMCAPVPLKYIFWQETPADKMRRILCIVVRLILMCLLMKSPATCVGFLKVQQQVVRLKLLAEEKLHELKEIHDKSPNVAWEASYPLMVTLVNEIDDSLKRMDNFFCNCRCRRWVRRV